MQSLGQAVYRFICINSRGDNISEIGVRAPVIVEEMTSRGYLEPVRVRVQEILGRDVVRVSGDVTGPDIVRINGRYIQKRAYLRLKQGQSS